MSEIELIVKNADKTKKDGMVVADELTGADILQAIIDKWELPTDTDYSLVDTTTSKTIVPANTLNANGVKDGAVLEIQPVLVAGS
ncbi:MAG: hypothetical protein OEY58_19760 [Gammaproteobacteria bacterium]|nr:hypothetical protein [Gammaproteobacteria bacterium]